MLKIFLVEDEVVVREGIKKRIQWEDYGFTFVGEASDGELAYPMICKEQPDVIITDIRMPFMDGLALSRLVRQEMPRVKIIILSGYDEFQYAKEAINIGVTDYLLKPVTSTKIIEAILRVKGIIEEEQEQKASLSQFRLDMAEHEKLDRRRFFEELVTNKLPMAEALERARQQNLELLASGYSILLFYFDSEADEDNAYSEQLVNLQQRIEDFYVGQKGSILFRRDLEGYALLVKGDARYTAEEAAREQAGRLTALLSREAGVCFFIGVGLPVQRLQELPKAFATATRALAYRYMLDQNQAVFFGELDNLSLIQDRGIDLNALDTAKIDQKSVDRFLKSGTAENAAHFVKDYLESWGSEHITSMLFRQYIVMYVHLAAVEFLEELGVDKSALIERCGAVDKIMGPFSTPEEAGDYLVWVLSETLSLRDQCSNQKYSTLLQQARDYILLNYANEELSLNQIARTVNVSPTYFSSVFSQEMGQTFIEYLTSVRIEKAKELLRCSGMKSSEIAYAVGYKDPHYFSFLFKKTQGCSPKEFRAGKAGEE